MLKEISVVFPAFNEEGNIVKAVTDADKYLKKTFKHYEIIVVNNGSRDKTKAHVVDIIKLNKHIKLINLPINKGYGGGLRAGFAKAKYELIFYTDADNQFDIKEIKLLLPYIQKYDLICGYRKKRNDPLMRVFTAGVYNIMINVLFRLGIRDVDCAFKIYKKNVFDTLKLHSNTGFIDAEILIKAKKAGFTFSPQVGVSHYPRLVGATTYELGPRGQLFAFVKPQVVIDILKEIKTLWREL
ncbi:MAG TPA: glycosyltransferase family 2 protein [Candidatus Acidoferrales bacterium]|nr:glycosyltransferase family 2 protein [Candidatus Acidoferrales bacterium]